MPLSSVEVEAIDWIKGVAVPRGVRFRQLIVTGPPGCGKSRLIQRLGGWPEEGCVDLAADHWWRNRILSFRPREVHFRFPFKGFRDSRTVFDREWLAAQTPLDFARIQIPPGRIWFFQSNWKARYVFDFQLLPAERIYTIRKARAAVQSHPVDHELTKEEVERQCAVYELLAQHFQRCGMRVIVRTDFEGMPRRIVEAEEFPTGSRAGPV